MCWFVCVCFSHSVVSDSETTWIVAHQAPLSMGFSRQEYWSRLPFSSPEDPEDPEDLPNPGIKPASPALQTDYHLSQQARLSPCLFNLYAECIMQNARLDESQAGIKIAGEVSVTLDMQMTPLLWQKARKN